LKSFETIPLAIVAEDLCTLDIKESLDWTDLDLISFDVVIPTKNSIRTIKECLKALFSSDVPVNNVFVIDKGNDSTAEIAEEMGCISIMSNANYSQALRLGASLCETSYFMILDSDILIHPKFYTRLKHRINENFICKGTFYDHIAWKSLANHFFTRRRKEICGLDAAFVNRTIFLKLTEDWDRGLIDAGGDTLLFRRCKERGIPAYQDPDLVNLHLVGSYRRYLNQTYWYGKSARISRLYSWTYFFKRFYRGFILGFKYAFRYRDLRYFPFMIWEGVHYLLGWLQGNRTIF